MTITRPQLTIFWRLMGFPDTIARIERDNAIAILHFADRVGPHMLGRPGVGTFQLNAPISPEVHEAARYAIRAAVADAKRRGVPREIVAWVGSWWEAENGVRSMIEPTEDEAVWRGYAEEISQLGSIGVQRVIFDAAGGPRHDARIRWMMERHWLRCVELEMLDAINIGRVPSYGREPCRLYQPVSNEVTHIPAEGDGAVARYVALDKVADVLSAGQLRVMPGQDYSVLVRRVADFSDRDLGRRIGAAGAGLAIMGGAELMPIIDGWREGVASISGAGAAALTPDQDDASAKRATADKPRRYRYALKGVERQAMFGVYDRYGNTIASFIHEGDAQRFVSDLNGYDAELTISDMVQQLAASNVKRFRVETYDGGDSWYVQANDALFNPYPDFREAVERAHRAVFGDAVHHHDAGEAR